MSGNRIILVNVAVKDRPLLAVGIRQLLTKETAINANDLHFFAGGTDGHRSPQVIFEIDDFGKVRSLLNAYLREFYSVKGLRNVTVHPLVPVEARIFADRNIQ